MFLALIFVEYFVVNWVFFFIVINEQHQQAMWMFENLFGLMNNGSWIIHGTNKQDISQTSGSIVSSTENWKNKHILVMIGQQ